MMKETYIEQINKLAEETNDIELLDFICQLLEKAGGGNE